MKPDTPDPDAAGESDDARDEPLAGALRASRVLVDAPEALIQRTLALFEARAAPPAPARRAGLPWLLAALQFDSAGASPLAFGMRSAGAEVRQLLYALPDCDVDLRVAPAEGGYGLSGQLLGPASQGVVFAQPQGGAAGPGDAAFSAALNELGEFRLPPLPAGTWQLTLELSDRTLALPPLELAPAGAAPGALG